MFTKFLLHFLHQPVYLYRTMEPEAIFSLFTPTIPVCISALGNEGTVGVYALQVC